MVQFNQAKHRKRVGRLNLSKYYVGTLLKDEHIQEFKELRETQLASRLEKREDGRNVSPPSLQSGRKYNQSYGNDHGSGA